MKKQKEKSGVGFKMTGIKTTQFAVVESAWKESEKVNLKTNIRFEADKEHHAVAVTTKFEFVHRNKSFLIVEVSCSFAIEPGAWDSMCSTEGATCTLPRGFAMHLAVLTVGTARGVLHAKTENTAFNRFMLPTINLTELIEGDAELKLN